jgi:PleD family two-component response regulator
MRRDDAGGGVHTVQRVNLRWLLAPPLVGAAVIANMDGGRKVYEGFYLYIALAASCFLPGGQVRVVIAAVALGAAVPLLEDSSVASIVRWAYVAAGTGIITLVLRTARRRVRAFAAEVRTLALQDQLTGALNRRGFELRASQEFGHARRRGEGLVLLYLDLDGFKLVNDNLSHAAGDRVLQRTAHAMAGVLRVEDVLARVGGDEFVVLFWVPRSSNASATA